MKILTKYTLRSLKQNKSRTYVTICGIVLSLAMLSAVTILVTSAQDFLKQSVIRAYGNWHGAILGRDNEVLTHMESNPDIDKTYVFENIGYALDGEVGSGTYINFMGTDVNSMGDLSIDYIISENGHLPTNPNEILLPDSYLKNEWENPIRIGDTVTFDIGRRKIQGQELNRFNSYTEGETFEIYEQKTYTVTGFYKWNILMENNIGIPVFTAIAGGVTGDYPMDVYYTRKDLDKVYDIMDLYTGRPYSLGSISNSSLIRFSATTVGGGYNALLYGMQGVLYAIIIFASISLIYNAFAISIGERVRRFGLLSSIGATSKQLINSVLTEAAILCCIGIPLGIFAGIAGIGLTLELSRSLLDIGFNNLVFVGAEEVPFKMVIRPLPLAASSVLGLVTVLISAYLPVRKAFRQSAIDSIRQASRIMPEKTDIKVLPFMAKLAGFEGTIAIKNFKRSKNRYRATVFSLFTSIVLFIAAWSFCDNLERSADPGFIMDSHDVRYVYYDRSGSLSWDKMDKVYTGLKNLSGVTGSIYTNGESVECVVATGALKDYRRASGISYSEIVSAGGNPEEYLNLQPGQTMLRTEIHYIDDESYDKWLAENGLEKFTADGRFIGYTPDNYNGKPVIDPSESVDINYRNKQSFQVRYYHDTLDVKFHNYVNSFYILMPYSFYKQYSDHPEFGCIMLFSSDDPSRLTENISSWLKINEIEKHPSVLNLYNENRTNCAIVSIIRLFAFGFITLISLIAAANAFNTVSTNISIRRRELAVFTSAGMTHSQMKKMLAAECGICGLWAMVFGIPTGIGASVLVYVSNRWNVDFRLPVPALWISVALVTVVMLRTMVYTLKKVSRQNLIETLKNENA